MAAILASVAALCCMYGATHGATGIAVNDKRALQEQVDQAEGALKQVIENLPVGLFTFRHGTFNFTNWAWDEQMARMAGQTPVSALGKSLSHADLDSVMFELAGYEAREEPFRMRFELATEFGDRRFIDSHGVPVYGADGAFSHMLGFNVDVTSAATSATDLDSKNRALESALSELAENLEAMVSSLVKAIEAKDPYTAGHSERVMEYSVRIGEALGLGGDDLRVLRMGTLIHDIGKIGVPDEILTKPDRLTKEEYEVIKRHPVTGYKMICDIPFFKDCAPIVRWHHERLDGTGYPDGLRAEEIPLLVQISTVADMFDAMTSNRAYRRSLGVENALAELRKDAARGAVNAQIVDIWEQLLVADGMLQSEELHKAA